MTSKCWQVEKNDAKFNFKIGISKTTLLCYTLFLRSLTPMFKFLGSTLHKE